MAKVPVQFLILFIGTMVFVFFLFVCVRRFYSIPAEMKRLERDGGISGLADLAIEQALAGAPIRGPAHDKTERRFRNSESPKRSWRPSAPMHKKASEDMGHKLYFSVPLKRSQHIVLAARGDWTDSRRHLHGGNVVSKAQEISIRSPQ